MSVEDARKQSCSDGGGLVVEDDVVFDISFLIRLRSIVAFIMSRAGIVLLRSIPIQISETSVRSVMCSCRSD